MGVCGDLVAKNRRICAIAYTVYLTKYSACAIISIDFREARVAQKARTLS